jgi:hypothetical protein
MKLAASFLVVLAITTIANSQSAKTATVAQIEAYAKSIDRLMNRHKEPDLIIADVSDYDSDDPKWQRFKSSHELEAFREKTETYTIANNWRLNGKLVSSLFTLFSPSGDWAQYVSHYFRPDGTAAKVTTEMRTFNGDYIIIREMYFDSRGKLLKKASKYLDLTTKKPKKPTAEMTDENSESYKADYYKKVSALPFYTLTKTKI